jgi:ketosteroid isomerase-like protein
MQTRPGHEDLVRRYFDLIRELRTGVEGAPERLRELWDPEGIFEFAGSPPVTGTFTGINAITALYQNRFAASGMPLRLQGIRDKDAGSAEGIDTALGVVDTDVHRIRVLDDERAVAGWTTVIGTRDEHGFQVSGSHSFTFKDRRISKLRIVVSPKPDATEQFDASQLAVDDIGRLSLAAWMVV